MNMIIDSFCNCHNHFSSANAQYDIGDAEWNASLNTIISKAKVQFS
jgi:hypothetical protein